jgi:hypothetical protein
VFHLTHASKTFLNANKASYTQVIHMSHLRHSDTPELVVGLVGPIGVDMNAVQRALEGALRRVEYTPHTIHLTRELPSIFPHLQKEASKTYNEKISLVNKLRTDTKRADILAMLSILKICEIRATLNKDDPKFQKIKRLVRRFHPMHSLLGNSSARRRFLF